MDEIIKKLTSSGVPSDIIEKLKSGLGDTFESSIASMGLKGAAKKIGLDTASLPDIDFKNALEAVEEFTGKDLNRDGKIGDGDGKSGMTEAVENAKEALANTDISGTKKFVQANAGGIFSKIKGFFGA